MARNANYEFIAISISQMSRRVSDPVYFYMSGFISLSIVTDCLKHDVYRLGMYSSIAPGINPLFYTAILITYIGAVIERVGMLLLSCVRHLNYI